MEPWKLYAFAAAIFAGLTSVIAKAGLNTLAADVGLAVRTAFVFGFVLLNTWLWTGTSKTLNALHTIDGRSLVLLALSALTTTLSWVCYYRAMKEGAVTYVSLVDKGSLLVTILLAALFLGEPLTWRVTAGAGLILAGLLVLVSGK